MSNLRTVLAIDSGTQSVRAILFDQDGNPLAMGRHAHKPLIHGADGAVEQDPDDIWTSMVAACRECMDRAREKDLPMPLAAGVTSQRKLLFACDRNGDPLRPAIHWMDRRRGTPQKPGALGRALLMFSGDEGVLSTLIGMSQGNVLREFDPEVYRKASYLLTVTGWLTFRLTGELRDAAGSIVGVYPIDVKTGKWQSMGALWKMMGYRRETLPDVVPAGAELGRVTPRAAEETGLPAGMPLVAVGGDKQAEVLGAGVTPESGNVGEISMGTGTSLSVVRRRMKNSMTFRWIATASAQPKVFAHEYMVFRGFWTWTWFLNQFGQHHRTQAEEGQLTADELLSEEVSKVPPGSEGLLVIPRWHPTFENLQERGAMIGFLEHHTRAHVARAIVEGIIMDLRRGAEIMEEGFGFRVDRLRVGGGGAKSMWAVQTLADVFDVPVDLPHTSELSALGAAINAAVAADLYPDHDTAARAMVRIDRTVEPNPRNVAVFSRIYRDGFLTAIDSLQAVYDRMP